jgi:hypothetical protein
MASGKHNQVMTGRGSILLWAQSRLHGEINQTINPSIHPSINQSPLNSNQVINQTKSPSEARHPKPRGGFSLGRSEIRNDDQH